MQRNLDYFFKEMKETSFQYIFTLYDFIIFKFKSQILEVILHLIITVYYKSLIQYLIKIK